MSIIRLSERLKNPIRKDGPSIEIYVYSFLTTEPNAPTVSINHERMPASSEGIEFETWLSGFLCVGPEFRGSTDDRA